MIPFMEEQSNIPDKETGQNEFENGYSPNRRIPRFVGSTEIRRLSKVIEEKNALIAQIEPRFRDRIVMHNHDLHSCHTLEEVSRNKLKSDYVFLSPIFDSISKQGYHSAFTRKQIAEAHRQGLIDERVMALGGVTFSKIEEVKQMGFGGAMILGDAWK